MVDVLKRPIVTEKMTDSSEKINQYGFIVDKRANKIEIRKAVESMYNVSVENVNTANFLGKRRSRHSKAGMITGRKPSFKKAYVTLKDGDAIDFYSNV
ncbi:MAG: 50S ribosomal protein L23 [Bacteroidia bacterium]|nr:50S ribosomal protein L23 [Bacteroidia bacterium]MBN4052312.1 50S ribosomal protein L23 [Sphingobacteriaceae bacterium AH-315-L07]